MERETLLENLVLLSDLVAAISGTEVASLFYNWQEKTITMRYSLLDFLQHPNTRKKLVTQINIKNIFFIIDRKCAEDY